MIVNCVKCRGDFEEPDIRWREGSPYCELCAPEQECAYCEAGVAELHQHEKEGE